MYATAHNGVYPLGVSVRRCSAKKIEATGHMCGHTKRGIGDIGIVPPNLRSKNERAKTKQKQTNKQTLYGPKYTRKSA